MVNKILICNEVNAKESLMLHTLRVVIPISITIVCIGCANISTPTRTLRAPRYLTTQQASVNTLNPSCDPKRPPETWGVIVGVNFYQDEGISDLKGAVADAWAFYHFLASPKGGNVHQSRLRLLLNYEATRSEVEGAIGNFLGQSCPQDRVIIYFAGHGAPEPGRPDEAFLLVHDTKLDNMVGSAVSMQRLPDFLKWRTSEAGELLLIVDACHSGNIVFPQSRGIKSNPKKAAKKRSQSLTVASTSLKQQDKWSVLSAAAADQYASEAEGLCTVGGSDYSGGIFTCRLLKALSGEADRDADFQISIGELASYLEEQVGEDTSGAQTPVLSGSIPATLPFFKVPTNEQVEIPKVPQVYLVEEDPQPLKPYKYSLAAFTLVSATGSLVFNLLANDEATRLNANNLNRTEVDFRASQSIADAQRERAEIGYMVTGGLALFTLALTLTEALMKPQDRAAVYQLEPWIKLRGGPNAGASIQGSF